MGYKDPKNVRTLQVQTRLTTEQKEMLDNLAERNKMTPSTFIQQLIVKAKRVKGLKL